MTRTKTEELIENNPTLWSNRHHGSLTGQLARKEALLEAIANDAGVPRSVGTSRALLH